MIPLFKVYMSPKAGEEVNKVLYSGFIGQGKKVDEFEQAFSEKFVVDQKSPDILKKNESCLSVNSATSGLHLFYHMFGSDYDEVLTSPLTCTASNWPILANRKRIKWVDVDNTCNMDLDDLERKLSPTTKFINLIHWGGNPINLHRVEKIREKCFEMYGFFPIVIQDCAHAIGSMFDGKHLSSYYNSVFSFQAIKHVTSVDGGMMVFQERKQFKRAKLLRWYGIDRDGERKDFRCEENIPEYGFKFHMNDVNATIGLANLQDVESIVLKHRQNSLYYDQQLKKVGGVDIIEKSYLSRSSDWIHTIHVEQRDNFVKMMTERGIMVSRVHERNDKHSCVRHFQTSLPGVDKCTSTMICIPNGWWLTEEEREYIVNSIRGGW